MSEESCDLLPLLGGVYPLEMHDPLVLVRGVNDLIFFLPPISKTVFLKWKQRQKFWRERMVERVLNDGEDVTV